MAEDKKWFWFDKDGFRAIIGIIIIFVVLIVIVVQYGDALPNNSTLVIEVAVGVIIALIVTCSTKKSERDNQKTLKKIETII